jgi:FtsZ-interacting cell division protein ZipA
MDAGLLVVILVVLVLLALLALVAGRQRRSRRLQDRFGPEYQRTVEQAGDRRAAETELRERAERRERLDIVPLDPEARERYVAAWRQTQAQFVDEPGEACREADRLITSVMRDRGYPVDNFEQRAADVSVDHPRVVEDYRAAHAIAAANDRSEASTEDLRQALVHYRSLFEELLDDRPGGPQGDQPRRGTEARRPDDGRHPDRSTEEAR